MKKRQRHELTGPEVQKELRWSEKAPCSPAGVFGWEGPTGIWLEASRWWLLSLVLPWRELGLPGGVGESVWLAWESWAAERRQG